MQGNQAPRIGLRWRAKSIGSATSMICSSDRRRSELPAGRPVPPWQLSIPGVLGRMGTRVRQRRTRLLGRGHHQHSGCAGVADGFPHQCVGGAEGCCRARRGARQGFRDGRRALALPSLPGSIQSLPERWLLEPNPAPAEQSGRSGPRGRQGTNIHHQRRGRRLGQYLQSALSHAAELSGSHLPRARHGRRRRPPRRHHQPDVR